MSRKPDPEIVGAHIGMLAEAVAVVLSIMLVVVWIAIRGTA